MMIGMISFDVLVVLTAGRVLASKGMKTVLGITVYN